MGLSRQFRKLISEQREARACQLLFTQLCWPQDTVQGLDRVWSSREARAEPWTGKVTSHPARETAGWEWEQGTGPVSLISLGPHRRVMPGWLTHVWLTTEVESYVLIHFSSFPQAHSLFPSSILTCLSLQFLPSSDGSWACHTGLRSSNKSSRYPARVWKNGPKQDAEINFPHFRLIQSGVFFHSMLGTSFAVLRVLTLFITVDRKFSLFLYCSPSCLWDFFFFLIESQVAWTGLKLAL